MANSLSDQLLDPARFDQVVDDCSTVVNNEVKQKGLGIRTVFKLAQSAKPGLVEKALRALLPDFCRQLDPYYADYKASGSGSFSSYILDRRTEVAQALLEVTDRKVIQIDNKAIQGGYSKLRGRAASEVAEAAPKVAAALEPHLQ